jgi:RNA polymerase sigma-54 factor
MKQSLQLKLSQHLTLTPQLQQSIRLLQMSTVELNQELERYLLENPMLERDEAGDQDAVPLAGTSASGTQDALSASNHGADGLEGGDGVDGAAGEPLDDRRPMETLDDSPWGDAPRAAASPDDEREDAQLPAPETSLQEHLLSQLMLLPLSTADRQWAAMIVAHIDDDGYLSATVDELAELAVPHMTDDTAEARDQLQIALRHVRNMDPVGVGAQTLAECLALQLAALQRQDETVDLAMRVVSEHLDALAVRDFTRIRRLLRCSDTELRVARELIVTLDPKPGRRFSSADIRYVVPDVVVRRVRGRWSVALNHDVLPRLRVNQYYAKLLQQHRSGDGKNLAGQLQEARWLVKNIQQRFDTILRVSQAIVDRQRHFFDHGDVAMRPLVLREIADIVELHESTISRVTTQKYMMTPRGIYELKYFFGSSLSTEEGGECSSTAIRAMIRQLVQAEDNRKPLSDNSISDLLAAQGIVVARRTVAKYREAMQIQPASQRRSL